MKKTIIVATLVILIIISLSVLVKFIDSSDKSLSNSSRESEEKPLQMVTDYHELSGLNCGPGPSGFDVPTITGVDSIPVTTSQPDQSGDGAD